MTVGSYQRLKAKRRHRRREETGEEKVSCTKLYRSGGRWPHLEFREFGCQGLRFELRGMSCEKKKGSRKEEQEETKRGEERSKAVIPHEVFNSRAWNPGRKRDRSRRTVDSL